MIRAPAPRGTTLIEVMLVIAIVGIMSGLAVMSMTEATRVGRVNGGSTTLAAVLTNVRTRALTERCTYVLQINGPTYNASAAPLDVLRRPSVALIYRKNNCASDVGAYESGVAVLTRDRLIEEIDLAEFHVDLTFPTGIVSGGVLGAGSVSIAWQGTGQRMVFADPTASGTSADTTFDRDLNVTIKVTPRGITTIPYRDILVSSASGSRAL